jgi:DNA polymerase-3 subunit delta'
VPIDPNRHDPDQLEGVPHPREATRLFGHDKAIELFLEALQKNKLHHAWLLLGKEGIGKATLAYLFAKFILSPPPEASTNYEVDVSSRNVQLISSGAHPNLLVLQRTWNPKTKKFRSLISVDDVRELQHFLGRTAGMGKWRVVIVDKADDLNMNAANALLKMLEEPPAYCLFLLVSSEPGKLPITIRSRCQKFRLEALDDATLRSAVSHISQQAGSTPPDADQLATILKLAEGSVRLALEFSGTRSIKDFDEIMQILDLLPRVDQQKTIILAERLSGRANDQDYHSFLNQLSIQLANRIKQMVLKGQGDKHSLAQWTELWETITTKKNEVDLLNLDRGNFILDLFAHIEDVAGKNGGLKL